LHEHCQDGQLTAEPRRSPREGGLLHINEEVKMIQYQLLKTNIKTHFSQVRQLKTPLIDFLMEPSNVDYPRILVLYLLSVLCLFALALFINSRLGDYE
jgi:hypothetical protein